jgi:short subunit dehydrogenase-like uncharacterized protein
VTRTNNFLIYGATGYTGALTARAAKEKGMRPILAGRNEQKLKPVADRFGFEYRAFDLSEQSKLDAALGEVDVVLHTAGPFSATSKPMADACLRTGTHYLDITGEIDVFEALAARDAEAKKAGVMLLPGVGFDVVPSDCLAMHMKERLPDATDLKICIAGSSAISRGTTRTLVEGLPQGVRVRRDGRIVKPPQSIASTCDFGKGPRPTMAIPWGDVSTAYHSTKIPNIEVHMQATSQVRFAAGLPDFARRMVGRPFAQSLLKALVGRMPEGPTEEVRSRTRMVLVGAVANAKGERASTRLTTSEGYTLTAQTGAEIARRVAAGEGRPGFQTPSLVFGADFILQFEGTRREELNA